jgi:membrane-associated protease RseP (regulator of RpoE activity)
MTMKTMLGLSALAFVVLLGVIGCVSVATPSPSPEPGPTSLVLRPAPNFGVVIDETLKVLRVEDGSTAEKAGVQIGDRIVRIRDTAIMSPEQARQVLYSRNLRQPIAFEFERQGKSIMFETVLERREGSPGASTVTPVPPNLFYF